MRPILEYLFSKKSDLDKIKTNRFGITEKDMIKELVGFPVGIVVRMMEEQEKQGNKPDVKIFQDYGYRDEENGGFLWTKTSDGHGFWSNIYHNKDFKEFYERHPEYKKYDS